MVNPLWNRPDANTHSKNIHKHLSCFTAIISSRNLSEEYKRLTMWETKQKELNGSMFAHEKLFLSRWQSGQICRIKNKLVICFVFQLICFWTLLLFTPSWYDLRLSLSLLLTLFLSAWLFQRQRVRWWGLLYALRIIYFYWVRWISIQTCAWTRKTPFTW